MALIVKNEELFDKSGNSIFKGTFLVLNLEGDPEERTAARFLAIQIQRKKKKASDEIMALTLEIEERKSPGYAEQIKKNLQTFKGS